MLNDTTRAMFTDRLRTAEPPLAAAIRRWLANPADGAAADLIEATPTEVGLTRTRCVATRLEGGHANNALPQLARATVNCRMFPGHDPAQVLATLRQIAAPDNVTVEPVDAGPPGRRLAAARGRGRRLSPPRSTPAIPASRSSPI